jgi:hypothetical protein
MKRRPPVETGRAAFLFLAVAAEHLRDRTHGTEKRKSAQPSGARFLSGLQDQVIT